MTIKDYVREAEFFRSKDGQRIPTKKKQDVMKQNETILERCSLSGNLLCGQNTQNCKLLLENMDAAYTKWKRRDNLICYQH